MLTTENPQIQKAIDAMISYREVGMPKAIKRGLIIGLIISVVIDIIILWAEGFAEAWAIALVVTIILLIVSGFAAHANFYSKLRRMYKRDIIPLLVKDVCDNAQFDELGGIARDVIRRSRVFQWYNSTYLKQEDYVSGIVDKTAFEFCEAHLGHVEETRDKDGKVHRRNVVDFDGLVFCADFNKDFSYHTILHSSRTFTILMRSIKMESVDFNKIFYTYCEDEQEARYILTPSLQERIVDLNRKLHTSLNTKNIQISFFSNRLVIFAPTSKDHFEPPQFKKITIERVEKDYDCVKTLVDIINDLNLNTRIWTKK